MSFKISPRPKEIESIDTSSTQDEWVEIIEPNSKTKIYANLHTGICAKSPPEDVIVLTTNDFSDHWWELYDKKTGKYYYYNPEQQVTVWTKPVVRNNGEFKRVLIIPVSKLKTSRRLSTSEHQSDKCDASTQTIASNLISTGTQTISETTLDAMLNDKLNLSQDRTITSTQSDFTQSSNNVAQPGDNVKNTNDDIPTNSHENHRQLSDFTGRYRNPYLKNYQRQATIGSAYPRQTAQDQSDHRNSSQHGPMNQKNLTDLDAHQSGREQSYFAPTSAFHKNRRSMQIPTPVSNFVSRSREESKPSTTTFRNNATSNEQSHNQDWVKVGDKVKDRAQPQQMVTNNLSHYLVREARAMGIALISDDEIEDDDQESDDECNLDDDEDTDLRDDLSSHRDRMNDLNASQDLGEDSSEGWKSLSEQGSPNGLRSQSARTDDVALRSPMLSESGQSSFAYDGLVDDQGNPSASMSQQLDHRKLVQNFKKSRQTSALGFNDSLGRSYKLDANHAVQKIKTVADSYFKHTDKEKLTEKHLRQISALSTLPRPTKEKSHLVNGEIVDADYDVVEENCGYYSDSDRLRAMASGAGAGASKTAASTATTKSNTDESPVSYFDRNKSTRGSTFSVESFARENLTRHPRGGLLFNRKVKWSRMISWTKSSIKQPMISSVSSDLNAESIAAFKLVQQFMGDRKITIGKKYRQILAQAGVKEETICHRKTLGRSSSLNVSNSTNSSTTTAGTPANGTHIPDRLRDELAYELAAKGCVKSTLRDEIFVQLARQLTDNPCQESISWGLILMSVLLSYFSPSTKFAPFLLAFLESHSHPMARDVCLHRLEKRLRQNSLTYCRKPADGQEIAIVRLSITKWPQYCGVFGESLEQIMKLQACSPYLKTLRLPWILTTLSEKLIETGGFETEGIFRCAADHDLLAQLRLEIDCVDFRKIADAKQVKSLLLNVQDPHVIAGLLKLFFRQLCEPVFPSRIYDVCLSSCQDNQLACRLFDERLPNLNKDVVAYLIRLLQLLAQGDKVTHTKMDTSNLSMVWAPNLLRAPELDQPLIFADSRNGSKWSIANGDEPAPSLSASTATTAPSQSMIFEHARQEMQFIKALINHLDTSFIKDVL